ncbi:MAG: beta-N-acetylglucosaminidase domain-containing protein [Clostridia bacterium]|nr:beta-N-acetylglucosaminidase domain-containing protein [Clostridia bacterium]MBQ3044374.1 beta-N-acetylglucosaminidase domain-containing protein [Clostridia bacterium]
MIYPAFQKSSITEWVNFLPCKAVVNGFESDYAAELSKKILTERKGETLYIDVIKENTRRTEYTEEAYRITDEKYFITGEKCEDGMKLTVTVSGKKSLYRAFASIVRMSNASSFPVGTAEDYPLFAKRGYIEGFYGNPWPHDVRRFMIEKMALSGMNTYYYAPKDDPYHRDKWDELYPEKELSQLSEISELCRENFVDFHYCIAPGLSMKYSSEEDFDKLCCKVKQLYMVGVKNFGLLVDDIPENLYFDEDKAAFDGEAVNAHVYLVNKFYAFLKQLDGECGLTVCPLVYHGTGEEYYISKLGRGIPSDVSLFWTGRNICSQELTVKEAIIFENSTNHKPLYWDNFPVNDAEMYNEMHIGYINGRDKDLFRYSEGIISNVMEYPMSSIIPLQTVCDYLWNPLSYDGFESWQKACGTVLGEHKETLMPFLDNLLTSCLKVENSPMMNAALNDAQQMLFAGNMMGAFGVMAEYTAKLEKCCEALETLDMPLISELRPWAEKQAIALEVIKSSLSLLGDNSEENKAAAKAILQKYLNHPKTLCDFSLQAFAERMQTL